MESDSGFLLMRFIAELANSTSWRRSNSSGIPIKEKVIEFTGKIGFNYDILYN